MLTLWLVLYLASTVRTATVNWPSVANENTSSLAESSMQFTWDAYRAISPPPGENLFFSPYSIMNAMGMLVLGSTGETETQLKQALRVPASMAGDQMHRELSDENTKLQSEKNATIGVANRFFVDDGSVSNVSPDYKTQLEDLYNSTLQSTPFAKDPSRARTMVNDFVSEQTRGEIKNILKDDPSPTTKLMLVNAIYFKGLWTLPFKPNNTKPMPFHAQKGDITTDFMGLKDRIPYAECPQEECQVVALPYTKERKYSMYIIVPKVGLELEALEAGLNEAKLVDMLRTLRSTQVSLRMPRFTMKSRLMLTQMLTSMGATDVFGPQGSKNSKIFTETVPGSLVSDVIHEAKVEVNEEGTVAAAATVVMVKTSLVISEVTKNVTLDRPFLFFIADVSNGFVLFFGRVEEPLAF